MSDAAALAQGEIFTGALPGVVPTRPRRATVEMKRAAAEKIVDEIIAGTDFTARDRDGIIEDLVEHGTEHMDGYQLAKILDDRCHWHPSTDLVDTLDSFGSYICAEITSAQCRWVTAYNIQPSLPAGTRVSIPSGFSRKNGTITGVYAHSHCPASYMVQLDGEASNSRRIVAFEDCEPLAEQAEPPANEA